LWHQAAVELVYPTSQSSLSEDPSGGAGFGWVASHDENGRGTLRFFAVDALAFSERQRNPHGSIGAPKATKGDNPTVRQGEGVPLIQSASLQKSQAFRDALFKALQSSAKKYTFKYMVIDLPAGTLPGINHSIPVTFIRYDGATLFAFDRFTLEPSAEAIVSDFAKTILKDRSFRSIVVVGHTDSVGPDRYNLDLSKKRAITVATALRTRGIPDGQLGVVPMGKAQPAETNSTPEGRALNRRVEFFISDIPRAPEAAIELTPYNPCHIRQDCTTGAREIPVLTSSGDQKGDLVLLRSLPRNSDAGFVRPPLPDPNLQRPSLKDLQIEQ
jgi:outer membrane protein OmpA-like peptidoglycan-associated protein